MSSSISSIESMDSGLILALFKPGLDDDKVAAGARPVFKDGVLDLLVNCLVLKCLVSSLTLVFPVDRRTLNMSEMTLAKNIRFA